ncbi:hypothetical protein [Phyllobacterium leguminum]|nr:hypothetical protein [Phyllobacterium leguminum]
MAEIDRHIEEDKRNAERRAKELAERLKQNPAEVETITVMKFPAATLNGKEVIVMPSDMFEDLKASLRRRKAQEAAE